MAMLIQVNFVYFNMNIIEDGKTNRINSEYLMTNQSYNNDLSFLLLSVYVYVCIQISVLVYYSLFVENKIEIFL